MMNLRAMKLNKGTLFLFALLTIAFTDVAMAGATANPLPWEAPLETLVQSITGPVAFAIAVLALVGLGALLIFQSGEMNQVMKSAVYIIMGLAFVVSSANILDLFFGFSGAVIG